MTTPECLRWLRQRQKDLGPAPRPRLPLEELAAWERRHEEWLSLWLLGDQPIPTAGGPIFAREPAPADPVSVYVAERRLSWSISVLLLLSAPYSPLRVRGWTKHRHLWWLVGISWLWRGRKEWLLAEAAAELPEPAHLAE